MVQQKKVPARLTVITLGVADVGRSAAFYEALGFQRKMRATGDEVAFFETGATAFALYAADRLAAEASLPHTPAGDFRGMTLAWNCADRATVDAAMQQALACGARLVKATEPTHYGGYCGYVADPDGHVWEIVVAPGIDVQPDGRVKLPE